MKLKRLLLAAVAFGAAAFTITSCSKSEDKENTESTESSAVTEVASTPASVSSKAEEKPAEDPVASDPMIYDVTEVKIHYDLDGGTTTSSTEDITVTGLNSECFMYDVEKEGFNFRGWSYDGTLVYDQFGVCQNTIKLKSEMTFKAVYSNQAILTIETSLPGAGTVTGAGEYQYNSYVDIHAEANEGYVFGGWSYDGNVLSAQADYKFQMWDRDTTITALYAYKPYSLTVESDNERAGYVKINTADGTGSYAASDTKSESYKSEVTVSAYTLGEKRFMGWYDSDTNEEITHNAVYTFRMPMADYKLTAKWESFEINFETNGGEEIADIMTSKMPAIDKLPTPVKTGSIFGGWYLDAEFTTKPTAGVYLEKDTILYAKWTDSYTVTYDTDGGEVLESVNDTFYLPDEFPYPSKTGYSFCGWYTDKDCTSRAVEGTAITSNMTLYAKWYNRTTYTTDSSDIYFGAYPQTHITNTKTISKLNGLAGTLPTGADKLYKWSDFGLYQNGAVTSFFYYIDIDLNSDGYNDYRGLYFTKYATDSIYSTSAAAQSKNGYVTNTVYWFSYDPIKWNVLVKNGKAGVTTSYTLETEMLLDYTYFCSSNSTTTFTHNGGTGYASNYELSDIRAWLNDDFYNTAFDSAEKAYLKNITVTNTQAQSSLSTDTYVCNNTTDKVWLSSYKEESTYYTSDATRMTYATDYTKALGIDVYSNNGSKYYLRSPASANNVSLVQHDGSMYTGTVYYSQGVRPSIAINA